MPILGNECDNEPHENIRNQMIKHDGGLVIYDHLSSSIPCCEFYHGYINP